MPGTYKTEGVVLRSIRYGEADRVLHLYTADRGRVGAVAKGVRRVRSRLGGRLEPLSRVNLVLHEGRGELSTISQVDTLHAHSSLRERRDSLERGKPGLRGGAAAVRLLRAQPPGVQPALQRAGAARRPARRPPGARRRSAFRAEAAAGRRVRPRAVRLRGLRRGASTWARFSPSAGGVVCAGCEAGSFPLSARRRTRSSSRRWRGRWPRCPTASGPALAQADRALAETLEHHAHVRLRRVPRPELAAVPGPGN